MKNRFLALLTLGFFTAVQLSSYQTSSGRPQKSPAVRAVEFYRWYLHSLEENQEPWTDGKKELSTYVSKPLLSELERSFGTQGGPDEDYFIKSQDYLDDWSKSIRPSDLRTDGRNPSVIISMGTTRDSKVRLAVTFLLESGEWKIRSVKAAEARQEK